MKKYIIIALLACASCQPVPPQSLENYLNGKWFNSGENHSIDFQRDKLYDSWKDNPALDYTYSVKYDNTTIRTYNFLKLSVDRKSNSNMCFVHEDYKECFERVK